MADTEPGSSAQDPAAILARFAGAETDAVGLLAYALHRQAYVGFRAEFFRLHSRLPDVAEDNAFVIGELAPARIAAYRAQANTLLAAHSRPEPPAAVRAAKAQRPRWPWMGMWITTPVPQPEGPVNWRGLAARLLVLLLAVIATALLLRVLVVRA